MLNLRGLFSRRSWTVITAVAATFAFAGGLAIALLTTSQDLPATPAPGPAQAPAPPLATPTAERIAPTSPSVVETAVPVVDTTEPSAVPTQTPAPAGASQMTFLVLGLDRRSAGDPGRTDVVMMGNVDFKSRRASLVSIPRDLIVNIPGFTEDRINTAYSRGELARLPGGGGELVRRTVEQNFNVTIDHYAAVDFNCFRSTVDALGGVTVNIPTRVVDYLYPLPNDQGVQTVVFEPGVQKLSGERALQYARTRSMDNDFRRMARQQQIVTALGRQLLQPSTITAIPALIPAITQACRGMASDLGIGDWVKIALAARDVQAMDVTVHVIDERLAQPYTTSAGASVLRPNWPEIRRVVRQAMPTTIGSN